MSRVGEAAAVVCHQISASRQVLLRNVQIELCLSKGQGPIDIPAKEVGAGQSICPGNTGCVVPNKPDVGVGGTGCHTHQMTPKKDCQSARKVLTNVNCKHVVIDLDV